MKDIHANAPEKYQEDIEDCIRRNVNDFNRLDQL